jgi:hypothetical protein
MVGMLKRVGGEDGGKRAVRGFGRGRQEEMGRIGSRWMEAGDGEKTRGKQGEMQRWKRAWAEDGKIAKQLQVQLDWGG